MLAVAHACPFGHFISNEAPVVAGIAGRGEGGSGGGACEERFLQSVWRAAQVSQPKKQIKINKSQVLNDTDYDIKKGYH